MTINQAAADKQLMADLKQFMIDSLTAQGVEKMFNDEPVVGFSEARKSIERAFEELEESAKGPRDAKVMNNEAR